MTEQNDTPFHNSLPEMLPNTTQRFTDRVADYVRYRPSYPPAVMEYLQQAAALSAESMVADIGSGTGIFTRQLLDAGCKVFAVEPNGPMRAAAESMLSSYPEFHSLDGNASATDLEPQSIDLIVCAQAFHWFNTAEAKTEFQRIGKANALVALIWNNRLTEADAFAIAYEALLQAQSKDYKEVNHQNLSREDFKAFFSNGSYKRKAFPNEQLFDAAGLQGRAFSSSYVPAADTDAGRRFAAALAAIFSQHQVDGIVRFRYETAVYLGRI